MLIPKFLITSNLWRMVDCPSCGQSMKYVGKSSDATAHGHHARLFECRNGDCFRGRVPVGW